MLNISIHSVVPRIGVLGCIDTLKNEITLHIRLKGAKDGLRIRCKMINNRGSSQSLLRMLDMSISEENSNQIIE